MIYADSSFLVSGYIQDTHSPAVIQRMSTHPRVCLTLLNRTELMHAMQQYVFRRVLSVDKALRLWNEFEEDCAGGVWIFTHLPESAWETSVDLARRYGPRLGVRTLDSLHVACALELKAERFWTFDERQARLADAVGLVTGD